MNSLGVHGTVWASEWSAKTLEHVVKEVKASGYDFLELPLTSIAQKNRENQPNFLDLDFVKSCLELNDLNVKTGIGLPVHANIASQDPTIAQAGEDLLITAVRCASQIGSNFLGGIIHGPLARPTDTPDVDAMSRVALRLRKVADFAGESGISLGVEVVNRYESNLVNTCEQGLELLAAIDRANVGIHADVYHMNIEENDIGNALQACGDNLAYVHIGESHRGRLGTGNIDFTTVFRALSAMDYQGPISVESFSRTVLPDDQCARLAVWRPMWDQPLDFAMHAHSFMLAHLESAAESTIRFNS